MAAPASSSSGGMTNLSRLLASSRLTAYQPGQGQVFTAPAAHQARGDFGLKRPLPTTGAPPGTIRYVDVSDMDTREGQTSWRERERDVLMLRRWSETHIKLVDQEGQAVVEEVGKLGPRLNTVYDPSTRRALPTFYDEVEPKEVREHLQREARQGRGPIHQQDASGSTTDNDAFSGVARLYSNSMSFAPKYTSMSPARFEKFLEQVRASRGDFKRQLALSAAQRARHQAVKKLNERRLMMQKQAMRAREEGATRIEVPEEVTARDLPLPNVDEVRADMWDQSRIGISTTLPWSVWLTWRENERASRPESQLLPSGSKEQMSGSSTNESLLPALHRHAGLQYSQPDSIQTQLLAPPLPGRVLEKMGDDDKGYKKEGWAAAVAGRIAYIKNEHDGGLRAIDWSGNDPRKGNGYFRPMQAWREQSIRGVFSGDAYMNPSLGYTRLKVRASESADRNRLARGIPGSPGWVAEIDGYLHRHSGEGTAMVRDFTMGDGVGSESSGSSRIYSIKEQKRANRQKMQRQRRERQPQQLTEMLGNIMAKVPRRKKDN